MFNIKYFKQWTRRIFSFCWSSLLGGEVDILRAQERNSGSDAIELAGFA
jgi:hypothetical protein